MAATERVRDRAIRRATAATRAIGQECREARMTAGLSQEQVARAAGVSRLWYTQLELGRLRSPGVAEIASVAAILGLDLVLKVYPGPEPLRDAGQSKRLDAVLAAAAPPLGVRREVPLPQREGPPEQRVWDAVIVGGGLRTAVELEVRLRDAQAVERRLGLKRRDDPADRFLLLVAASDNNRRVLREHTGLVADLPRLRKSAVVRAIAEGRHLPTGLVLV